MSEQGKKLSGAALGKFTPEIQDRLITFVRRGFTRAEAAKRCKISPRAFGYWMAHGAANLAEVAEAEEREPGSGALNDYGLFRLEVEAATQEYIGSLKAVVEKKAASDHADAWKAAAWLLERRSDEYTKRRRPTEADDPEDLQERPAAGGQTTVASGLTNEAALGIEEKFLGIPTDRRTP